MEMTKRELEKKIESGEIPVLSEEWKEFVADAIAKSPKKRSAVERAAIATAMKLGQANNA
jgi:hypothetical protein